MAQRVRFVAQSSSHVVGSPCGRRASFVRRGQRHRATNGHRRSSGQKRARCPAARAHPGSRTTCARADSPIDGVGLNPNERMSPPPPRPPNMCTETKWGKMLRLRSSKRGNAGRTERRLVSASAQSSAATPRACSRGLTCPARLRSGRRAGAAPPSVPLPSSVARPARYMKATGFARTECTLPSLGRGRRRRRRRSSVHSRSLARSIRPN